jgi:hypothetical protein
MQNNTILLTTHFVFESGLFSIVKIDKDHLNNIKMHKLPISPLFMFVLVVVNLEVLSLPWLLFWDSVYDFIVSKTVIGNRIIHLPNYLGGEKKRKPESVAKKWGKGKINFKIVACFLQDF